MLDEEGGQNGADGVQSAQKGGGDAAEAHAGHGGGGALPLLIAGEVEHGRTQRRQCAGDHQRQDDVALFRHAAVFGGILVIAGGPQLIAEAGLFQHHPDKDSDDHRQGDGKAHILIAVEQRTQTQRGQQRAGIGVGQHHGIGTGHLLDIGQEHIGQV